MGKGRYYRICPRCGCSLDPQEVCDCEAEKQKQEDFYRSILRMTPRTGQMAFVFDGKISRPAAEPDLMKR